ncbi:DUF998 domain-containing protein [Flavihumibacter petaseus]|uniref:DUF998 domain-containing protein n=1 Tax=Flavihumibacter petaseus NBRC 106054 TaxID=1220578 RepID=A0A0E9N2J5_9BACT|nr:DUF998 domain-containing protein [Flavihumibacter petaseus]GAO44018.1 hypothetical protein FPE01S_03_00570 [Flavihumibacter petaseus NBRC 106054]
MTPKTVIPAKWPRALLLLVLAYEALGSLAGGVLLIAAPDGRYMDMPVALMRGYFDSFLLPGVILLDLGLLGVFAFIAVLRRWYFAWLLVATSLGGWIIWFIAEIVILQELHWLHAMWGLPVLLGAIASVPLFISRFPSAGSQRVLLWCGIFSSLWYVAINCFVPLYYDGYSFAGLTVSELSAIHAPTRILWVLLALPYPLLFAAFGWGVLMMPEGNRLLRITGSLVIVYAIFNLYWPPMHMRGNMPSLTDTLHICWAIATNLFMWLFMILAAAAIKGRFCSFTIIAITLHVIFGALTFTEAPNIAVNGPTPMIGTWERINIAVFMLWVVVFAGNQLRNAPSFAKELPGKLSL